MGQKSKFGLTQQIIPSFYLVNIFVSRPEVLPIGQKVSFLVGKRFLKDVYLLFVPDFVCLNMMKIFHHVFMLLHYSHFYMFFLSRLIRN